MNLPPVALHHVFVAGGPHGSQIFERNLDQEAENESTITNASDTPHNMDDVDSPETSHGSSHKHAAAHYFKDESK